MLVAKKLSPFPTVYAPTLPVQVIPVHDPPVQLNPSHDDGDNDSDDDSSEQGIVIDHDLDNRGDDSRRNHVQ